MGMYVRYIRKYKLLFLIAVCCVAMEAFCDLMQPTLMANIIDVGVRNGRMDSVIASGLLMLLVTVGGACFATVRNVLASQVSQRMGADLRGDLFDKILHFSESSADQIESGSLITRMTNDTSQVTQFVNGLMRIYVKAPITCIGSIVLAVLLSPSLSVTLLCAVGIVTVLITLSMKMSYTRFAKVQTAFDRVKHRCAGIPHGRTVGEGFWSLWERGRKV